MEALRCGDSLSCRYATQYATQYANYYYNTYQRNSFLLDKIKRPLDQPTSNKLYREWKITFYFYYYSTIGLANLNFIPMNYDYKS